MRIQMNNTQGSSVDPVQMAIIQLAGNHALERMDAMFERGQRFVNSFYNELPEGSLTKRSIERGDSWSETASWARREGYSEFARQLDDLTWEYNALIPPEVAE